MIDEGGRRASLRACGTSVAPATPSTSAAIRKLALSTVERAWPVWNARRSSAAISVSQSRASAARNCSSTLCTCADAVSASRACRSASAV
eukprot:134504-Pleurochrysis_carterae.AAC.2